MIYTIYHILLLTWPTQPPHLRVSLSENNSQSGCPTVPPPPEVFTLRAPASIAVYPVRCDVVSLVETVQNLPVPGRYRPSLGWSNGKLQHLTSILKDLEGSVLVKTHVHLLLLTEVIQLDSLGDINIRKL